jgi:hypothetical protein
MITVLHCTTEPHKSRHFDQLFELNGSRRINGSKKILHFPLANTVIARISVTFSTLHSFMSVKKNFDEHVYLTKNAREP